MEMDAHSVSLNDAENALIAELDARATAARQTWTAAQQRTVAAIAEEQAALALLHAAEDALCTMKDALSRVRAGFNLPSRSQPAQKSMAANLTADVLAEVLKFSVAVYDYAIRDPLFSYHPGFAAASVSRHWRSVAIATPSLWSKVRCNFSPETRGSLADRLKTILSRSRFELLDMALLDAPASNVLEVLTAAAETALVQTLSRCRSIQLSWAGSNVSYDCSLLPLLHVHMPHLSTFRFIPNFETAYFENGDIPDNVRLLGLCPNLQVLDLSYVPFDLIQPGAMPLIKSFSAQGGVDSNDVASMCRNWPHLGFLDLPTVSGAVQDQLPASEQFSDLETLINRGTESLLKVTSAAQMPKLRDLTLQCHTLRAVSFFTNFLAGGICTSLRQLTLQGAHPHHVYSTFPSLPNLESLRFHGADNDSIITLFTVWRDRNLLHPSKLHSLHMRNCRFGSSALESLLAFIEDRKRSQNPGVSPILELVVVQDENYDDGDRGDLFPPWMAPRIEQLVENVTIDTARAYAAWES